MRTTANGSRDDFEKKGKEGCGRGSGGVVVVVVVVVVAVAVAVVAVWFSAHQHRKSSCYVWSCHSIPPQAGAEITSRKKGKEECGGGVVVVVAVWFSTHHLSRHVKASPKTLPKMRLMVFHI